MTEGATRRHNGSHSGLLKTHSTPKSNLASNRGFRPVRQMSTIYQAKKVREFAINENLGESNVVPGATLHDRTMIAAVSSTLWFMNAIGIGVGLEAINV